LVKLGAEFIEVKMRFSKPEKGLKFKIGGQLELDPLKSAERIEFLQFYDLVGSDRLIGQ
jgi:hypothetical protein